ncbi:O-antigen/teichoic acid export membrane protein [Roseibium hamelinense]|uniref:O-antigen/teichoic acid export membrane protein n=1 Tax=Roseibium hamelinense TaxID=150831 RepID=A0A562T0L3_9HYPH|nr:lipopolysaccharide biosynthesis protein [Roseibium hamelinense]MTI43836.1 lipopolysaccharide biosynthesis protein [Roseibium hamelinense]TWI87079.1 O-antigen/teichoic acid export membrane protein [Roseibium hamelinense]
MKAFLNAYRDRIAGISISLGSRLGSTVLSFLVLYVASHVLSTEEYGLYIFLFSVGNALGLILVFGQHILLVKHYRLAGHQRGVTNQALLRMNAKLLGTGCLLLCTAAAITFVFSNTLPMPYDHLPIAFVFAAIFLLSEYFQNYFRIHGQIALSLLPRENIWRILSALTIGGLGYYGFLTSGAVATELVTILLGLLTGYQAYRFFAAEGGSFLKPGGQLQDRKERKEWSRETFFFTLNNFFNAAAGFLETILIGIFLSLELAAFYFVAYRISMLLTLPVLAIDTVGVPLIAARFQEKDKPGAQRLVAYLSAGSFGCALIGGAFLYVAGNFILAQFDPTFPKYFDVLMILGVGAIAHAFFGPGTWLTMIGGGEKYLLYSRSLVFVSYIGLLALLSWKFGLAGVAFASIYKLVMVHMVSRHWAIKHWSVDNMATSIIPVVLSKKSG